MPRCAGRRCAVRATSRPASASPCATTPGRSFFASQQGTPASGSQWKLGAVGVAHWRGVPLGKALDDVLLAYEMNGKPLPPDHGAPVRLVVPGWVGIASIKWLGQIEVSNQPLFSPWNTTQYRMFGPDYPADSPPLTSQQVKSAFELPWDAALPARRRITLHGLGVARARDRSRRHDPARYCAVQHRRLPILGRRTAPGRRGRLAFGTTHLSEAFPEYRFVRELGGLFLRR